VLLHYKEAIVVFWVNVKMEAVISFKTCVTIWDHNQKGHNQHLQNHENLHSQMKRCSLLQDETNLKRNMKMIDFWILHHVVSQKLTYVSEVYNASIIRVMLMMKAVSTSEMMVTFYKTT
jgi:hypothetical protein